MAADFKEMAGEFMVRWRYEWLICSWSGRETSVHER